MVEKAATGFALNFFAVFAPKYSILSPFGTKVTAVAMSRLFLAAQQLRLLSGILVAVVLNVCIDPVFLSAPMCVL